MLIQLKLNVNLKQKITTQQLIKRVEKKSDLHAKGLLPKDVFQYFSLLREIKTIRKSSRNNVFYVINCSNERHQQLRK